MIEEQPFFLQFRVRQVSSAVTAQPPLEGMATIISFASCQAVAQVRASRLVAHNKLEILQRIRVMYIAPEQVSSLNSLLGKLYRRAELYGVSLHCDYWQSRTNSMLSHR